MFKRSVIVIKAWLGNKRNRMIAYGAVAAIVVIATISAIMLFGDHDRDVVVASKDGQFSELTDSTGKVTVVPKRKVYPIGKWDMEIPFINPFGSQSNYESVEFKPNQSRELRYVNEDNKEAARMTAGDTWRLEVVWTDQGDDPFDDLLLYIHELGGESYRGMLEGEWIVSVEDDEGGKWWGVSAKRGDGYILTVNKEFQLHGGETITIATDQYDDNKIMYFMTENIDSLYQVLRVGLAEGHVQILGQGTYEQGQYEREYYYSKQLYSYKAKHYTLQDMPQDSSIPILWGVSWYEDSTPKEVSITLDEDYEIGTVQDGERLGALLVHGDMLGPIQVTPPEGVKYRHPELNLNGDKTPEGDTLFWLPSGYWNIKVIPPSNTMYSNEIQSKLVPVSSGQTTVLNVTPMVRNSYANAEIGNSEGGENRLVVEQISGQGEKAEVTFMLLDSKSPKFTPTLLNTQIVEGGKPGKVTKIERIEVAPSVVITLDSSGSMMGSMDQVLDSARTFIKSLPDNTHIEIIDFDTEIRSLTGTTKAKALKNLDKVKASGGTALYDAVIKGLSQLKDKERPTLLVFSDGEDSREEPGGVGSKATKQEVVQAVQESGIPLFTIGFGPGHDDRTLLELAGLTGGTYYSAQDTKALDNVFTSISDRLGNRFVLTYDRPKEQAPSDTPVVSITLDVSGSMDIDPATGNGDYRIDKVKNLLYDFIKQVPDNSMMQFASFAIYLEMNQIFTSRKSEIMQSLGNVVAFGGTDILGSSRMTYHSLLNVPSEKRVMVYVTDAALDVPDDEKESFERILSGIKEEGIQVLWVGLGTDDAEEAFKWAAEKSGGKYVISEDPAVLNEAFQKALAEVQNKPAAQVSLNLTITNDTVGDTSRVYATDALADFPAIKNSNDRIELSAIQYEPGKRIIQYDSETAGLLYGSDIPSQDIQILKRFPLHVTGKNDAMEWTAREVYFMKKLKGVEAPYNKSFMAVDMELKNIHPEGAKYVINDFAAHFFATINDTGSYPASMATWLTETSLAPPGETGVSIAPDETIRGVLVFMVPDENTEQASLNFYDTSNGHISLALIGTPSQRDELPLTALPTQATGKLSDTFSMTVQASNDLDKIEETRLDNRNSVFKVIEAELKSNVQADLKMDPQDRFYLNIQTGDGPFLVPVNTATALLPYGLLRPVTMGPGSTSQVRFAFQTPIALKDAPMELYADLKGGGMRLPIKGNGEQILKSGATAYQGDGVTVTMNSLARVKNISGYSNDYVVADMTFTDDLDGEGTSGFPSLFRLVSDPDPETQEVYSLRPDSFTSKLLFGIEDDWAVFDGTSRRGFLVFFIPHGQSGLSWTLQSENFADLKLPVKEGELKDSGFFVEQVNPPVDRTFDNQLSAALIAVINEHKALVMASQSTNSSHLADLDNGNGPAETVLAPTPVVYGLTQLKSVKSMTAFETLMNRLRWLPSTDSWFKYRHSPEAVITQGWGNQGDLANLAGQLLARLGYSPHLGTVKVTDEGRNALQQLGNVDEVRTEELPAWSYYDEQGNSRILVVPFMKDLAELEGLAYFPAGQSKQLLSPVDASINVFYKLEPKKSKGINSAAGNIAGALGGGTGDDQPAIQEQRMLSTALPMDQLGNEAVDVRVGSENGLYTAILENQNIQIVGDHSIDPEQFNVVGIRIEVQLPDKRLVHETNLQEGEHIAGVYQTLAINLPDITAEARDMLQKAADRAYKAAAKPDIHSILSWYTRNILCRFVTNQTAYETELARTLDVTAGRTKNERVLVVTVRHKDGQSTLRTSIDLLQSANQLHRADEDAASAYQIMSGLFASKLEGAVLAGNKADFMEVWSRSPEDTMLFFTLPNTRNEDIAYMEEQGYPDFVISRVRESDKAILIQNKPTRIYGEDRWSWLEIDPDTFETIALMDTGEHGGFADYVMAMEPISPTGNDYLAFVAGGFIGVGTSVWSVASFSLELTDYEDILRAAKTYTYGICDALDMFMSNKDLAKMEYSIGKLKLKIEDTTYDYAAKYYENVKGGKEGKAGGDLLGFTLGFKSGAAYYFKHAKE